MQACCLSVPLSDSAYARKKPPKFLSLRDRNLGGTTLINALTCTLLLLPLSPVLRCAPHTGLQGRFRTVPVKASHQRLSLCNVFPSVLFSSSPCSAITSAVPAAFSIHFSRMNRFCQLLLLLSHNKRMNVFIPMITRFVVF